MHARLQDAGHIIITTNPLRLHTMSADAAHFNIQYVHKKRSPFYRAAWNADAVLR